MPSNPDWVEKLQPAAPQGADILAGERAKSTVNVDQLAEFLFTKKTLQQKQEILNILQSDPIFDKSKNYFLGRGDRILGSLARGKRVEKLSQQHQWTTEQFEHAYQLISEASPLAMHYKMFMPTIREQGTPEQHRLFLDKAKKFDIIGCYAQTELGHGSNVRGLETTATWNPEDKTFTIHSPALTASKWWIGSLGKVANYAVVMAQLVVKGKVLGPHPFIVQIRDLKTHEPLPNIHIGDIGPKFGFNTVRTGSYPLRTIIFADRHHHRWTMVSSCSTTSRSPTSTCWHDSPVSTQRRANTSPPRPQPSSTAPSPMCEAPSSSSLVVSSHAA